MPEVISVDKQDKEIGVGDKLKVHQDDTLHRAFSVLVFNSKGELMLQKRSKEKPIGCLLWSNTCCSHPRPNENIKKEAEKRLKEEMGFTCDLKETFSLYYNLQYGFLFEHEFDHVFIGKYDGKANLDKKEACDWKWISKEDLIQDTKQNPEKYTGWLLLVVEKLFGLK